MMGAGPLADPTALPRYSRTSRRRDPYPGQQLYESYQAVRGSFPRTPSDSWPTRTGTDQRSPGCGSRRPPPSSAAAAAAARHRTACDTEGGGIAAASPLPDLATGLRTCRRVAQQQQHRTCDLRCCWHPANKITEVELSRWPMTSSGPSYLAVLTSSSSRRPLE
jgi:hypothetical protein